MEIPNDPKDIQDTVFPDVFVVDYVRVYQKQKSAKTLTPTKHPPLQVAVLAGPSKGELIDPIKVEFSPELALPSVAASRIAVHTASARIDIQFEAKSNRGHP